MMNNKPHYRILENASLIIATVVMLISMSSITQAFGQREIYPFDPDYTRKYNTHELLYGMTKYYGEPAVAYEQFFSNHARKNRYTHCKIEYKSNDRKTIEKTTVITFNKKGFISSITKDRNIYTFTPTTWHYSYSNKNKTITRIAYSVIYKKYDTVVYYFNKQKLINNVISDTVTTRFLYGDNSDKITEIQIEGDHKIENLPILYKNPNRENNKSMLFTYISELVNGPIYLYAQDTARRVSYQDTEISITSVNGIFVRRSHQIMFSSADQSVFMEGYTSSMYDGDEVKYYCFYKWDSEGVLTLVSSYRGAESFQSHSRWRWSNTRRHVINRKSDIIEIEYYNYRTRDFQKSESFVENKEYVISGDRIELHDKIITYYK